MRIGIISDTHISRHPGRIIEIVDRHLKDADLIIHAGDYKSVNVVNLLKQYKNFKGVYGNVDGHSVTELLKETEIIRVMGYSIGVYHGHGSSKTTIERAYDKFKDTKVDIIIFGHSHQPLIKTMGRVLMLNPGSITSKRTERWYSCIMLELEKNEIRAEIRLFT